MTFFWDLIDKSINSEPKKKSLRVFEGLHKDIAEQAESDNSDSQSEGQESPQDEARRLATVQDMPEFLS